MCRAVSAGLAVWTKRSGWAWVGGGQGLGAFGPDGCGASVVDVGGGVQAEPAVAVLVVVPGEEVLAVRPGGLDGREARPVLQRLELRLGVRGVVGDVRAGVGLGDAQVGQQRHPITERCGSFPANPFRQHERGVHALSRVGAGSGGQRVAGAGWRRRRRVGSPVMVRP